MVEFVILQKMIVRIRIIMQDSVVIINPDYVVFETRSVYRVFNIFMKNGILTKTDNGYELNRSCFSECNESKLYKIFSNKCIIGYIMEFLQALVVLHNGNELIELDDTPLTSDATNIGTKHGIIGFKCEDLSQAMQLFETLQCLDYCEMLSMPNLIGMRYEIVEGFRVLLMDFDMESNTESDTESE